MYILFKHFLIAEMADRARRAGFGDCPEKPNFFEKGEVLAERKVLSELLKFSETIEELNQPNKIYISSNDFVDDEIDKLIRLERQKVNGYTHQVGQEKSLENINKELRYNEVETLFNQIREKRKLLIGQLKNMDDVELMVSSSQNPTDFEQN